LFDKLRGEFIDIIEWVDDGEDTLANRFPTYNREIQMGSSLIVRESQLAVFVYQGQIADVFEPGHYKLATAQLPVMTTLQHWTHGFDSPFKAEVYYFSTRQYTDLKWGTPSPVTLRDPEFGMVRIRAFGTYSIRIVDPEKVMRELSGTEERCRVSQIENPIRAAIVTRFTDFVAESRVPFLDFAANLNEFSEALGPEIHAELQPFGFSLERFFVQNISLPPEVEKVLDQRAGMAAAGGDLGRYTRYQLANALPDTARSGAEGGLAGAGLGAGMGMALGNALAGGLGAGGGGTAAGAPPPEPAQGGVVSPSGGAIRVRCTQCNHLNPETARFCSQCGNKLFAD